MVSLVYRPQELVGVHTSYQQQNLQQLLLLVFGFDRFRKSLSSWGITPFFSGSAFLTALGLRVKSSRYGRDCIDGHPCAGLWCGDRFPGPGATPLW